MSITPTPATDWAERVGADEAERHAAFSERISKVQRSANRRQGAGRAFHRKQVAGVAGELTVTAAEPELRQGVFAEPATFPVLVRMSNGAMVAQSDVVPDIRGLALSVRDVSGPGALHQRTDRQDFLLINRPAFGFADSLGFADLFGVRGPVGLARHLLAEHGPVSAPVEFAKLGKDLLRPFSGFATARFHSAAPIRYGSYAAMVRLVPQGARLNVLAARDWRKDVADRLRERPLHYELQVQFFLSEDVTPIEDLRSPWPEDASPFHPVARLRIPAQDIDSAAGRELAQQIEDDAFDPWSALTEHRPLGEVMRARKVAYFPSVQNRRD